MIREVLTELNSRMQKVIDGLVLELTTIRTGRATPALVENMMVNYHGGLVPLQQLASVSTPEANLILIQPWDRSSLKEIEKAILKGINLNPQNDGNVIRVIIPHLSEERRIELAKLVSKKAEDRRIISRNIRRDDIEKLRQMEKKKEISQDQLKNAIKEVDELTNSFIDKIDEITQNKEREIKEV